MKINKEKLQLYIEALDLTFAEWGALVFGPEYPLGVNVDLSNLIEQGFMTESLELTSLGQAVKDGVGITRLKKHTTIKASSRQEEFDEFWNAYPLNDQWGPFVRTRTLRLDKASTYAEWLKLINQGVTNEHLLFAIQEEKKEKVARSLISKENAFTFMQNCLTWLRTRTFESYQRSEDKNPNTDTPKYGENLG